MELVSIAIGGIFNTILVIGFVLVINLVWIWLIRTIKPFFLALAKWIKEPVIKDRGKLYLITNFHWLFILNKDRRIRPWCDVSITSKVLFTRWFMLSLGKEW